MSSKVFHLKKKKKKKWKFSSNTKKKSFDNFWNEIFVKSFNLFGKNQKLGVKSKSSCFNSNRKSFSVSISSCNCVIVRCKFRSASIKINVCMSRGEQTINSESKFIGSKALSVIWIKLKGWHAIQFRIDFWQSFKAFFFFLTQIYLISVLKLTFYYFKRKIIKFNLNQLSRSRFL